MELIDEQNPEPVHVFRSWEPFLSPTRSVSTAPAFRKAALVCETGWSVLEVGPREDFVDANRDAG